MRPIILITAIIALSVTGCTTPIAFRTGPGVAVQSTDVAANVYEVRRGGRATLVTIGITNRSSDLLALVEGSRIAVQLNPGGPALSLTQKEFELHVQAHGPVAMGLASWSSEKPPVLLDPVSSHVNLQTGQEATITIAFESPREATKATLDLTPALTLQRSNGAPRRPEQPLVIDVDLPNAPSRLAATKEMLRNVHFSFMLSSDDLK